MPPFPTRLLTGLPALLLTLSLPLLAASPAEAVAGVRDVRVAGDAPVRAWASRRAPAVEVVRAGGFVTLEGEVQAPWYRVRTTSGKLGWIAGKLGKGLLTSDEGLATKPTKITGSLRLLTAASLRGGPVLGRPVEHELASGTIVRVLDQYGTWVLLGDTQGRSGWTELSTFVAAEADEAAAVPGEETRTAAKDESKKRKKARPEPVAEEAGQDGGPSGAELRRQRLEERRAARAAELAEEKAEREARRLEREQRKAAREAERVALAEAKLAEEEAAALAAAEAAKAEEIARAERDEAGSAEEAEKRAAADAKEAEREAARAAKEAEREAKAAERRAAREAREAERQAAREARAAERRAAAEAVAQAQPADGVGGEVEEESAEDAAARKAAEAARKAEEKAAREAEKQAAKEAREAERLAKKAEKQAARDELRRPEPEPVAVQAIPEGPVAPVAIPPSLGVTLDDKAPSEKKPDPARSPLAREEPVTRSPEALPVLDLALESQVPRDAAAAELLEGFQPYSESGQVDRSVESLHEDEEEALELSFAERPSARGTAFYLNEAGDLVDTTVVSGIVLRVGAEILTLSEFERLVDEARERESVRTGRTPTLDETRRSVLQDSVEKLLLVHHGRAIGVRFDAIYESAKEDFKQKGGISDDLELLRLLDDVGMTFKEFRREMIRSTVPFLVIRSQVSQDVTVSEEEIDNYYRRHQDDWVNENCVLLRELVLQPEARETTRDFNLRLEEILDRLEAGEDFCDLSRRHSRAPSAADCGQLADCFTFSQLDEKVARVVFKMRPGDIEPVRTDWGYHLLRVEEQRPRRVRTKDEVRDAIVRKLQTERLQQEVPRYLNELRQTVRVEVSPAFRRYWNDGNGGGLGQ